MPICTDTALPSIDTTVLPFMYQPKLPVENCLTSASISWPLMMTFIGSAFSRNCVRGTGQGGLGGIATAPHQKPGQRATFGRLDQPGKTRDPAQATRVRAPVPAGEVAVPRRRAR